MTTSPKIVPCLWFNGQAERAAAFYTRALPAGRIVATARFPESMENPSGLKPGSVLTVDFEVAGQRFTALNGGPFFTPNPSISFFVHVDTAAEVDRLFNLFADGGEALMPLDSYPFAERYGWVKDRFGVSWQVIMGRRPASGNTIVPSLLFVGTQAGKATQALEQYARIFPGGQVVSLEHYGPGEGPAEMVKYGRAILAGHDLVAMDSDFDHKFAFNEGLSLQVMCDDQAEVDRYWEALAEGGEHGQCGWLKDRFGVSWQVAPTSIERWINSKDEAARARAFAALMEMTKLDIAALDAAFEGR